MKFKSLDGKIVSVDMRKGSVCKQFQRISKGQKHLGKQLMAIYPMFTIFEDFIVPASQGLSLDFFIPNASMAFEFNGQQHYEYNAFFHDSADDFKQQKGRDERKREWCRINDITLVEVSDQKIFRRTLRELIQKAILKQNKSS